MGVDIHLHTETLVAGVWEYVPEASLDNLYGDRDIPLYMILQGKRVVSGNCRFDPLSLNQGVPTDLSVELRDQLAELGDYECDFGFHFITLRELQRYDWLTFLAKRRAWFGGSDEDIQKILTRLTAVGSPDEVRIVYWFDR